MIFNRISNLQQFIIPDILNNSGINNFSKGYIYKVSLAKDHIYRINTFITRRGKEGKQRVSPFCFHVAPLLLLGTDMSLYGGVSFIYTKSVINNVINIDSREFVYFIIAKFSFLENFNYTKHFLVKDIKRKLEKVRDEVFSKELVPNHLFQYFELVENRIKYFKYLVDIEQFCRLDIVRDSYANSLEPALQLCSSISGSLAMLKGQKIDDKKIDDKYKKLVNLYTSSKEDSPVILELLKKETNHVLHKYTDNSYWI